MNENNQNLIQGIVASIDRDNIDTDQIIPTEYLKSIKKSGFGEYLFDGWRYHDRGKLGMSSDQRDINSSFILNHDQYRYSSVLLTKDNFGCGSSREHAVWALRDFGFKAVIASSFGDIFYNNCFKNRVLPIILDKEIINELFNLYSNEPLNITIFLDKKIVDTGKNQIPFQVDNNLLERIIYGLDDVDITLKNKEIIKVFEQQRKKDKPWIYINE